MQKSRFLTFINVVLQTTLLTGSAIEQAGDTFVQKGVSKVADLENNFIEK